MEDTGGLLGGLGDLSGLLAGGGILGLVVIAAVVFFAFRFLGGNDD